jgi:glyoxylase-like metal-dependent hydrolase (beta-lactamase superfamily II)
MPNETVLPGLYRRRIGNILVTALSDGIVEASLRVVANMPAEDVERMLGACGQPVPPRISVNAYALEFDNRIVLIDTGAGDKLGPTLGNLTANLAAAGIAPDNVDTVLLTHMHPDHSNGLTDTKGAAVFPNAELVLHEDEMAHWLDDGRMAHVSSRQRRDNFEAARNQLMAYRNRTRVFRQGSVLRGIDAVAMPGHTPGHTGYRVTSGAEALLVWGDLVHLPDVQILHPEVSVVLDTDQQRAASTRKEVLETVAADGILVTGMHLHFPGFSRLVRDLGRFELIPELIAK